MTGFNCLICNRFINGISNQIKTEGKCQLLCKVLQNTAGSFIDLDDLWITVAGSWQICPECDAKLVQLDHYLEQLSIIQASIERIQNEIREDSIKSQLARKTKHEPVADHQDYFEAGEFLNGSLLSLDDSDSFNYNDSNDQDFSFDDQPIDELESEQGNDTDQPNKIANFYTLDREVRIVLEPLNLPAGVLTFNLKTDQEIINYVKRSQAFIKKGRFIHSLGKASGKKKKEKKPKNPNKKFFYPFKCDVGGCKKGFTAINFLMAHKKDHQPKIGGKYSCDYCKSVFKLMRNLGTHLMTHGFGDSKKLEGFKCPLCPKEKIFQTQYSLSTHIKRHGDSHFNSICEICGEEISGMKSKMDLHLQTKHGIGEDLVKCPKCPNDQFYKLDSKAYKIHLAHHLRLEFKAQQTYICEFCTSTFVTRQGFEEHQLRKHISPDHKEKCPYEECSGQEFASKNGLSMHIRGYHKKMYKCPHCDAQCIDSTRLKVHIKKIHLCQRDYQCDFYGCEKSYYQAKTLLEHKRSTHSQIRPFKCSYKSCSKTFTKKTNLKRHELLHTGLTRFVCEFCSEGYNVKESLHIHIQRKHKNTKS